MKKFPVTVLTLAIAAVGGLSHARQMPAAQARVVATLHDVAVSGTDAVGATSGDDDGIQYESLMLHHAQAGGRKVDMLSMVMNKPFDGDHPQYVGHAYAAVEGHCKSVRVVETNGRTFGDAEGCTVESTKRAH